MLMEKFSGNSRSRHPRASNSEKRVSAVVLLFCGYFCGDRRTGSEGGRGRSMMRGGGGVGE